MTLAQRIMELLNGIPQPIPTSTIIRECSVGIKSPRNRVWDQLKRLEKVKKVIKVSVEKGDSKPGAKWMSRKWYREN